MIYSTVFNPETLEALEHSVDSGFETIDQVVELMGDGYDALHHNFVNYGDTCYSTFKVM